MGRFHCILDSCAEVWLREYLPGYLEYQYPNEEKQVIEGCSLTYTLEQEELPFTGGQCYANYYVTGYYYNSQTRTHACNQVVEASTKYNVPSGYITGRILAVEFSYNTNWNAVLLQVIYERNIDGTLQTYQQSLGRIGSGSNVYFSPGCGVKTSNRSLGYANSDVLYEILIEPVGHSDNCGNLPTNCTFTVFNNNEQILQRTEEVCPIVEQFPPTLNEVWKKIPIEKKPYWEKVQVVDNNSWHELISELKEFINGDIPDECIEIWKTPILDLDILPGNTRAEKYEFIGQYCSPQGCPPPKYEVVCNEDCQGCPEGTCQVDCGDRICCYDENGIAKDTSGEETSPA